MGDDWKQWWQYVAHCHLCSCLLAERELVVWVMVAEVGYQTLHWCPPHFYHQYAFHWIAHHIIVLAGGGGREC